MGQCYSFLTRSQDRDGHSSQEEDTLKPPRAHHNGFLDQNESRQTSIANLLRLELSKRAGLSFEDLRKRLFNRLEDCKVGEKDTPIILPSDIKALWTPILHRTFYMSQTWYESSWDESNAMEDYLRIMSILIYINFRNWDNFRKVFINRHRQDKDLPFCDLEALKRDDFLGEVDGKKFYDEQWIFCPIKIQEREKPYDLNGPERLPWIDSPSLIGEGASGRITQQTIAAGFLEYDNRTVNPTPKAVAIKCVHDQKVQKIEFDNLKDLRRCLSGHKSIMVNLATIVEDKPRIGKMHHIVYELAAYDLGVFLTTMRGNMRAKRNVTPDRSRTDSCCMWPGDLIVESRNLADALDYLHSRLYNTSKISLAHNDIKPDNILVVYPDSTDEEHRYPVGKWKLADFGLSRVKVQRQHDKNSLTVDNAMPTPRRTDIEITHRIERSASVSKTTPKRDTGKYTAPEIDQKKIEEVDGRSADLWSFGCVLSEIIAYAVTLDPKLVEEFREALYRPVNPEQPKFLDQRFYDVRTKEVKCCFPVYLDHLAEVASQDTKTEHAQWTNSCIRLVKSIVVKDPAKRLRADQIRDCLRDIDSDMRKDKKMWLSNVLHVDTTHVADADHSYSPGAANASATESPKEVDHFPFVANGSSAALDEAPTITFSLVNHSR